MLNFCLYLTFLLSKMQNTFLELLIKRILIKRILLLSLKQNVYFDNINSFSFIDKHYALPPYLYICLAQRP